jgi:phytoene dehydrogenase-like protein
MQPQFAQYDVIIVGGGLAGLSAAVYLARGGKSVTLLEKSSELGGRASTRDEHGYLFNRGAHAFYTGGAASEILAELAITYDYGIPRDVFLLQGGKLDRVPVNTRLLLSSSLLDVGDKLELMRLFTTLPKLKASDVATMSAQEWLEQNARRTQVRRLLTSFAHTFSYSSALDLVSAQVFLTRLQCSRKHPIHYINGGWQTLVNALRQKAEQAGARIVSDRRVEAVVCNGDRVEGVRLHNGPILYASTVIIAAEPQEAVKLVDSTRYPALREVVDTIVPVSIACLDVALSRPPSTRYPVVQDMDQPRFLTTPSFYTCLAPEGGALISMFRQLDPMHPVNQQEIEHVLENYLDTIQPGWRDVLVKRIYLPHINAASMLPTASIGGFAGRPTPEVTGIANLYLIGDWIGPEGYQIDASLSSARHVARKLLQGKPGLIKSEVAI